MSNDVAHGPQLGIHQDRKLDDLLKSVKRFRGLDRKPFRKALTKFIAIVTIFTLFLFVVYYERYPPKYYGSYDAISRALNFSFAEKEVHNSDSFWAWFNTVITNVAGSTYKDVNIHCLKERIQTVTINGVSFETADPRVNFDSCLDSVDRINGWEKQLLLTGNHELLSFGIFTKRAPFHKVHNRLYNGEYNAEWPLVDDDATVAQPGTGYKDMYLRSSPRANLDSTNDPKVIQICDISNNQVCVLSDGFNESVGSTLNWNGVILDNKLAFDVNSNAYIYFGLSESYILPNVKPCYTHGIEDEIVAIDGNLTNCHYTWVSRGRDMAGECLNLNRTQPPPAMAFAAALFGYQSVLDFLGDTLLCSVLLSLDLDVLHDIFVEADYPLSKRLASEDVYGTFITTYSPPAWIGYGTAIAELLKVHSFIDEHTASIIVYIVARDLSFDSMYYTHVSMEFVRSTNGNFDVNCDVDFFPIVHYTYGLNGYPWREQHVVILEGLMILASLVFTWILGVSTFFKVKKVCKRYQFHNKTQCVEVLGNDDHTVTSTAANRDPSEFKQNVVVITDINAQNRWNRANGTKLFNDQEYGAHRLDHDSVDGVEIESIDTESGFYDTLEPSDIDLFVSATNNRMPGHKLPFVGVLNDESSKSTRYGNETGRPLIELILEWIMVVMLVVFFSLRYRCVVALHEMHSFISALPHSEYDDELENIIDRFRKLANYQASFQLSLICVMVMFIYQFFAFSKFHPAVSIVVDTVVEAGRELLPLLGVFLFIMFAYGIVGTQLYGPRLEDWMSIEASMVSLFNFLVGEVGGYSECT